MIYKTRNRSDDTTESRKEKGKKTCFNPVDTRRSFNIYIRSCVEILIFSTVSQKSPIKKVHILGIRCDN